MDVTTLVMDLYVHVYLCTILFFRNGFQERFNVFSHKNSLHSSVIMYWGDVMSFLRKRIIHSYYMLIGLLISCGPVNYIDFLGNVNTVISLINVSTFNLWKHLVCRL